LCQADAGSEGQLDFGFGPETRPRG
jgi:hypothetical protein